MMKSNLVYEVIETEKQGSQLTFPTSTVDKVIGFMQGLKQDNPRNWASISTIASQTGVSNMYTRIVVKKLCEAGVLETGYQKQSKKYFFRLKDSP